MGVCHGISTSGAEIIKMGALYRSDKCQQEDYCPAFQSDIRKIKELNPRKIELITKNDGNWQARIAVDRGGGCEWKPSVFRVGIKLSISLIVTKGKEVIYTSYVPDIDGGGYGRGCGADKIKTTYGDQRIITEIFHIVTHHS